MPTARTIMLTCLCWRSIRAEFAIFLEDVLDSFSARNGTLTFVFDTYRSNEARAYKRDTLQERMEEPIDEVLEVTSSSAKECGAFPHRGSLSSRIPMPMLTMGQAKAVIKRKGRCGGEPAGGI